MLNPESSSNLPQISRVPEKPGLMAGRECVDLRASRPHDKPPACLAGAIVGLYFSPGWIYRFVGKRGLASDPMNHRVELWELTLFFGGFLKYMHS